MTAAGGWLLVPLVLTVVTVGWGLLVDRLTGRELPAALLPGVGLAAMICATGLVVLRDGAGPLVAPLAAAGAVLGLVLGRERLARADLQLWAAPLLAAAGVLVVQALPTLLDGAVIAGYGRLDDSATWLGLTDRVIEQGRAVTGLPPGTYTRVLQDYLAQGYPVGSLLPVGVGARLSGQDVANAYQPTIGLYAVVVSCSLYAVARTLVASRVAAALVGFGAAQASLLYGYAQWGGVKELAAAALLATLAPLVARSWRLGGERTLLAVVLVVGGLTGTLGVSAGPWVLPAVLLAFVGWLVVAQRGVLRRSALWLLPVGVLAALPALSMADLLVKTSPTTFGANAITEAEGLGRLLAPLNLLQGAGLWPQEDFRTASSAETLVTLLALGVVALALAAAVVGVRRRAYAPAVLLAIVVPGTVGIVALGSPWIDAKSLAITSPFVLGCALALVAHETVDRGRRSAAAAAVLLAVALAVSTTAVARSTPGVPRDELTALRDIGERFDGQGPTLFLGHQVYATRHFLRDMDVEGASERRDRFVRLVDGSLAPDYTEVPVDRVAAADLAVYALLVRRVGAPGQMPAGYTRVWDGPFWEVWRRPGGREGATG